MPYGLCDGTVDCENFKDETGCGESIGAQTANSSSGVSVQQSVGSNPGRDTCVPDEQGNFLLSIQG